LRTAHLKQLYLAALEALRLDAVLLSRIRRRDLVVILNLHRVSPHPNPFWPPLHPALFEELLGFASQHFHITTLHEPAVAKAPRPRLILSFDDGYQDFVEYAMPLLHRFSAAVNLNVIPTCVTTGLPPWNVQLYDFLNTAPLSLIREIELPGFPHRLEKSDPDAKMRYGLAISRFLKNRSRHDRQPLWDRVLRVINRGPDIQFTRMMTCSEIRETSRVHEVGAHSFSHDSMGYEELEFFREDLGRCFRFFQEQLKSPLTVYAFPNGSYRPENLQLLLEQGVDHVLLVGEAFAHPGSRVRPRITIYGDSVREIKFQALGYKMLRVDPSVPRTANQTRGLDQHIASRHGDR
jgi:peptidoglycan/xylan/chitin deacetylase (PgdA/CDA1 family)